MKEECALRLKVTKTFAMRGLNSQAARYPVGITGHNQAEDFRELTLVGETATPAASKTVTPG